MARRAVAVAGPGVAGVDGGELGCGGRSSGVLGFGVGWPESTAASSAAAAGAQVCSGSALHGTARSAEGLYGLLGSSGALEGNERRWRTPGARGSPAMADGGFGCLWGGEHSKL